MISRENGQEGKLKIACRFLSRRYGGPAFFFGIFATSATCRPIFWTNFGFSLVLTGSKSSGWQKWDTCSRKNQEDTDMFFRQKKCFIAKNNLRSIAYRTHGSTEAGNASWLALPQLSEPDNIVLTSDVVLDMICSLIKWYRAQYAVY